MCEHFANHLVKNKGILGPLILFFYSLNEIHTTAIYSDLINF